MIISSILTTLWGILLAHFFAVILLFFCRWFILMKPGREIAPTWTEKKWVLRNALAFTRTAISRPLYWIVLGAINAYTIFEALR